MWPNEITQSPPATDGKKCGAPCSCDPCEKAGGLNAPLASTQSTVVGCNGTGTTEVRARASNSSGYSSDWTRAGCVTLRLKSGGNLPLTWNRMGAAGAIESAYQSGWKPGGAGSVFSFLPRVNAYQTPARRRYSEDGSLFFDAAGLAGSWVPDTAVLGTTYFTTAEPLAGTYFEYWAGTNFDPVPPSPPPASDPLFGALNRRIDRNGNELRYTYSAASGGPTTILRKITGDIGGNIVPYFEYADETSDAPVTKIYLSDLTSPQNSRTIYFEYISYGFNDGISNFSAPYLSKIVSPGGCVRQYDPRVPLPVYGITEIKREVDPEGYETYFEYAGTIMTKSVEPEGRITYYSYDTTAQTSVALLGRPKSYMIYGTASGGGEMPVVLWETNPLGNTTYFDYNLTAIRAKTQVEANGNVTYFEHFNAYPIPVALTRQVNGFNGASTYFGYSPLYYDVVKEVGPRHASGFPVVTYYAYDSRRNRISRIDALGGTMLFGRDSLGRIFRMRDALGGGTYFNFDASSGGMTSKVDALGNSTYFRYDSFLNATRQVSARWPEIGYSAFTTYYEFDALDRNTKAVDPMGGVTYFDWTSRGDLLSTTDARGTMTTYAYNGLRLRTQEILTDSVGSILQQVKHGFDIYKNLVRTLDPWGNATYFKFDVGDRLTARQDALGNVTYLVYDSVNNLTARTDARDFTTTHFYDALSRETCTRDALGQLTYFGYDLSDNRVRMLDPRRNPTYYFYDPVNRLQATRDALGNPVYYFYDLAGNTTAITDARFSSTLFGFDAMNRVTKRRDALGNATYFGFDAESNRTRTLNALGSSCYYFYDALNRLKSAVDGVGNPTYFGFDAVGNRTRSLDARGNASYFFYNGLDRLTISVNALGNATYMSYDAGSRLTRSQDARANTIYYSYDALNRLQLWQDPTGLGTVRSFDEVGNVVAESQVVAAEAQYGIQDYGQSTYGGGPGVIRFAATYYAYDANGQRITIQDELGASTYYEYDPSGNQTKIVDARGNPIHFAYDALNRKSALRDALGNSAYYFYDLVGNRAVLRNPLLHSIYFGYDLLNRQARIQDGLGGTTYFAYDGAGNMAKVVDPNNRAVLTRFDAANRPDAIRMPDGGSSYFFYDRVSNRTKEIDPRGNATYFSYDAVNRMSGRQDALGRTLYFEYDPVSNVARCVAAEGAGIVYTYDAANRRIQTAYTPAGSAVSASLAPLHSVVYDKRGDPTQTGDLWGQHLLGYDTRRRLLRHQFPNGSVVYFEYDQVSNLITTVYPGAGGKAGAAYDAGSRQSRLQAPSGATAYFTYDAESNLTQRLYGNSAKLAITYDAGERVATWRNAAASGAMLAYFDYTRDAKGLVSKCVRESTHTTYHFYDSNDRLSSEVWTKIGSGNKTVEVYGYRYAYDPVGNRIKERINGVDAYYFYDRANQLTVRGANAAYATPTYYLYDKDGSLTNLVEPTGPTYFAYNTAGLVARIKWRDASSTYFFYNGNLQRYAMVAAGQSAATYFLWDGPNVLQELNADGTVKEENTNARMRMPGIGQLVETNRPGQAQPKLYPVMDPRGSIVKWTQSDGSTVFASREYDSFGQIVPNSSSGTWPGRFGYQGQTWLEILSGNGQQRMLLTPTRVYDPGSGRFLQNDPLVNRRRDDHYLYAAQSPMQSVDVQGSQGWGITPPQGVNHQEYQKGFQQGAGQAAATVLKGVAEPVLIAWDIGVAAGVYAKNKIKGTDIVAEQVPMASALGERLKQNVIEDKGVLENIRAGVVTATALPTGGGSIVLDSWITVAQRDMTPEQASDYLWGVAQNQIIGTCVAMACSSLAGEGPTGRIPEYTNARQIAIADAEAMQAAGAKPPAHTVAVDIKSGDLVSRGTAGRNLPSEISPGIGGRAEAAQAAKLEPWDPRNCAEFHAGNKAELAGKQMSDLEMYTVRPREASPLPRCENCKVTTAGANVPSDQTFYPSHPVPPPVPPPPPPSQPQPERRR